MTTTLINLKGKGREFWNKILTNSKYIYIGRFVCYAPFKKSKWFNPFSVTKHGRKKSIQMYEDYILKSNLLKQLPELKDKVLCCWCKPQACHGDILIKLCESRRTLENGTRKNIS